MSDARLKNWTKWQQEWKKSQDKAAQKLELPPGDLLCNLSEGLQNVRTEKQVLEYAKIPTEFDKYRGKPDFYKLPHALPKKFKCCCRGPEPAYFLVKTKIESLEIPPVELVGVPERIRQEKNILNGSRSIYKKWQQLKYRQQRMVELAAKIGHIVPHWPHFDDLVVVGTRIEAQKSEEPEEASFHEIPAAEVGQEAETGPIIVKERPRLGLKINGVAPSDGPAKIRIFFEHDVTANTLSVDFVNLQNFGLATIRVSWRKIDKFRLFRNYTEEKWEKFGFYFDKKELIVLPGQTLDLPVWFKAENSGTMSESWELITTPSLDVRVTLVLESNSYFKDLQDKVNQTLKYIEARARNLMIKDILHDLFRFVKYPHRETEPCVFGEAELFEVANLADGRPLYLYNERLVHELNQIHDGIKTDDKKWDLRVPSLISLAHFKDKQIYLDRKSSDLAGRIERMGSSKGPSPVKEKSQPGTKPGKTAKEPKKKSAKSVKSSKTSQLGTTDSGEKKPEIIKEPYEYSTQLQVWNLVKNFDTPVIVNSEREKYFACFSVMAAYVTKICSLLEEVEDEKQLPQKTKYPPLTTKLVTIPELPSRQVYEYFEDHYMPQHSDLDLCSVQVKRKPKILLDIASDDIETLYTTYFNTTIVKKEPAKSKKLGKEKKGPETKKGTESDKKKSKDKILEKEGSVESCDFYGEPFIYTPETEKVEGGDAEITTLTSAEAEDYYYKQYIVVYTCLSSAVDAIVDTIQSFQCAVPHLTLQEVKGQVNAAD